MAQLVDPRFLLTDASNVPQNGAKLRIYDAGTANLTSVFSDAALSVPLTNPVVASSSGILPQVFAAEGAVVDLQWLTSADVAIPGRSYEDVTFVGADTGDLTRTVTGNARFKLTGSGGANLWQVGDASPDNTGGTLTIEGWAGTQGDALTFDFATTDTTGYLKERTKRLTGVVETAATTFSAVTSVDITLPEFPPDVRAYLVEVFDFSASTNHSLTLRASYDGGGTFKSGASDYKYANQQYDTTGGAITFSSLTTTTAIQLESNYNGATDQAARISIEILTVESGTGHTHIRHRAEGVLNTGAYAWWQGFGYAQGSYGRVNAIRLITSAGTITGKYRIVPLRGYGEA
jgi:hypothetical protein